MVNKMLINMIIRFKINIMNFILKYLPFKVRKKILQMTHVFNGKDLVIKKGIWIENYKRVVIGNGCAINSNVKFYTEGGGNTKIILGDNVSIARDVVFETGMHEIGHESKRAGKTISKDIKVGNGCWIGLNSTILPGVTIGEGCIIQAGSVVLKDCKPNCIYGGNPAELIMDLNKIKVIN